MKWILYIMLFTTPAANVTNKDDKACLALSDVSKIEEISKCRPNFEGRHVWSLQSTSQLSFARFETCLRAQDELVASSNVAATMTMRTWCFCEAENDRCPTAAELGKRVAAVRNQAPRMGAT